VLWALNLTVLSGRGGSRRGQLGGVFTTSKALDISTRPSSSAITKLTNGPYTMIHLL